MLAKEEDLS